MPPAPNPILERLREIFAGHFDLAECKDLRTLIQVADLPAPPPPTRLRRFLITPPSRSLTLRVSERLDVTADAYIVDHELGTIGLVHLLQPGEAPVPLQSGEAPEQSIREQITRRIGEAAYLRHLLLEALRPGEVQQGCAPYSVEVVLVLADPSLGASVGNTLQSVVRDFAILHAIGVSLLNATEELTGATPPGAELPAKLRSDLRRAFSWLLHETRAWMKSDSHPKAAVPSDSPGPVRAPDPQGQPTAVPWIPSVPAVVSPHDTPAGSAHTFRRLVLGHPVTGTETAQPGPPSEFWLRHFRLGGTRQWHFSRDRILHLVHGQNGSGKSSFVEAFELITTGGVERIFGSDCRVVITNTAIQKVRGKGAPEPSAAVMLRFDRPPGDAGPAPADNKRKQGTLLCWRLHQHGVTRPLARGRFAGSGAFRLNQEVMALLSQSSSGEREQLLFQTYFPEGYDFQVESNRLEAAREAALQKLPARLSARFRNTTGVYEESRADSELAWVQDSGIPWDRLPTLLPLDSSQVDALLPLLPLTFESHCRRTGTAPTWEPVLEAAAAIDQDLRILLAQAQSIFPCLHSAREFLVAYQDASAVIGSVSDVEWPERLYAWLELLAATDMLRREHDLLATLEQVHPEASPPSPVSFPGDVSPVLAAAIAGGSVPNADERRQKLAVLNSELAEARRAVGREPSATERPAQETGPLHPLAHFDLNALDTLARAGVFGRDGAKFTPKLSEAVRTAFRDAHVVPVRLGDPTAFQIGEPGVFRDLATRLERATAALQALENARTEFTRADGGVVGIIQQLRDLRTVVDAQKASRGTAAEELVKRLGTRLGAAVNEFTAMLTPARWAYSDVVSQVDIAAPDPSFGFIQGDSSSNAVPAQLRLNTAQLSAFSLAFFLLCHRAREHPLRIGILDDPFENMDELTVTTVARGLGRYLRLRARLGDGPDVWQLILFLHGEQNVERVRREVPCATYLLPWLSPGAQLGKEQPIQAEKFQVVGDALQDLTQILSAPTP